MTMVRGNIGGKFRKKNEVRQGLQGAWHVFQHSNSLINQVSSLPG